MFVQLETNWYVNIYQIRQIRDHPDVDRIVVWIEDNALGKASAYGRMYGELSREAALRTLRFWRMRRSTAAAA